MEGDPDPGNSDARREPLALVLLVFFVALIVTVAALLLLQVVTG